MKTITNNKLRRSIAAAVISLVLTPGIYPGAFSPLERLRIVNRTLVKQPKLYKVTNGTWGAAGAEMVVEKTSAKLTFDCANGEIPLTLKKDKKGNFKVEGTYTRRGFGPIRINNPRVAEPVMYEGKVAGRSMSIKITLIATGDFVGSFTLTREREATIRGCR